MLVDSAPDLEVVGEAADGAEAVELAWTRAARRRPDGHPDAGHGRARGDPADHVADDPSDASGCSMLTTFDLDEYVFAALRAGASGFLLKDTPPATCSPASGSSRPATRCSSPQRHPPADRGVRPPPRTAPGRHRRARRPHRPRARGADAGRQGLSNAEIAGRLHVTPATAKTHVSRLLTKLGARDRAQLIVIAYETGLVSPSGPRT